MGAAEERVRLAREILNVKMESLLSTAEDLRQRREEKMAFKTMEESHAREKKIADCKANLREFEAEIEAINETGKAPSLKEIEERTALKAEAAQAAASEDDHGTMAET